MAFQADAFQNDAFQIAGAAVVSPQGTAAWLSPFEKARPRQRTADDIQRDRERFGLPKKVDEAIEEVIAKQEEPDAEALEEALREELKLKRIAFRTRYLEALAARLEATIGTIQAQKEANKMRVNAMILMMMAASAF